MKHVVLWAVAIATFVVYGDKIHAQIKKAQEIFLTETREELSAIQAAKTLINNPEARIFRCHEVELSDKLTLKKKKRPSKD